MKLILPNNILKLHEFILVLSVVLISKSLYYESYGQNALYFPLFIYCLYLKLTRRIVIDYNVFFYLLTFVYIIILGDPAKSTFILFLIRAFIGIVIINMIPFERFIKVFTNIMFIIGGISLLTIPIVMFNIKSPMPPFTPIDGRLMSNFIFFGVADKFRVLSIIKNNGIWWEPGAFALFLNIAYLFTIIEQPISKRKIIFLGLAIISTFSTTGIIAFILLSLLFLKSGRLNILIFIITAFLILGVFIFLGVIDSVFDKFDPSSNSFVSFLSRYYDMTISYDLFKAHPLTGYGYATQVDRAIPYGMQLFGGGIYSSPLNPTGSDGITMFISQIGITSFIYLFPLLFPIYLKQFPIWKRGIVAIALFFSFNTENFTFTLIFLILILYGIKKSSIERDKTVNSEFKQF